MAGAASALLANGLRSQLRLASAASAAGAVGAEVGAAAASEVGTTTGAGGFFLKKLNIVGL